MKFDERSFCDLKKLKNVGKNRNAAHKTELLFIIYYETSRNTKPTKNKWSPTTAGPAII